MTHEWEPFTADYDYEKRPYLIRTAEGVECRCWPNAGVMNSMDASGRRWGGNAGVECKFAYPDDDEMGLRAMEEAGEFKRAANEDGRDLAIVAPRQQGRTAMRLALMAAAMAGANVDVKRDTAAMKRKRCTHKFGIAGGFSECPSCEVKAAQGG